MLVIGIVGGEDGPAAASDDASVIGAEALAAVLESLRSVGAKGKSEELTRIPAPAGLSVTSVLAVGLGAPDKIDAEQVRRSAGVAARALTGVDKAATTLSRLEPGPGPAAEGFFLGAYSFTSFKSEKSAPKPGEQPIARVELLVADPNSDSEFRYRHPSRRGHRPGP